MVYLPIYLAIVYLVLFIQPAIIITIVFLGEFHLMTSSKWRLYPLLNCPKSMENHHVWVNPLFQSISMAIFNSKLLVDQKERNIQKCPKPPSSPWNDQKPPGF